MEFQFRACRKAAGTGPMRFSHDYESVRQLGRGGMGIVELWRDKDSKALVVAKRVDLGDMNEKEEKRAMDEVSHLRKLKHPNVVRYLQSFVSKKDQELVIVQEHCPGGDLAAAVTAAKEKQEAIPEAQVLRWIGQLSHALRYCHQMRILHRDLKPSNVFLSGDLRIALLGDFGIAKMLGSSGSLCKTFIGTTVYMSPEACRMQNYGLKSDVWGLGTILFEVCAARRAFEDTDILRLTKRIATLEELAPGLPTERGYSQELAALCRDMLIKDVAKRPMLSSLLLKHKVLWNSVHDLEIEIGWEVDSLLPRMETVHEDELLHVDEDTDIPEVLASSIVPPSRPVTTDCNCRPPPPPEAPQRWEKGTTALTGYSCRDSSQSNGTADLDAAEKLIEMTTSHDLDVAAQVVNMAELTLRQNELVQVLEALPAEVLDDQDKTKADLVDARLQGLEALQNATQHPLEMTSALGRMEQLGIQNDECGQALKKEVDALHDAAVETLRRDDAEPNTVERAWEVLKALQKEAEETEQLLKAAQQRLTRVNEARHCIQLQCTHGSVVRLISVSRNATFGEVMTTLSRAIPAVSGGARLVWRNGALEVALQSGADWRKCLERHPVGPVDIIIRAATQGPRWSWRSTRAKAKFPNYSLAPKAKGRVPTPSRMIR